MQEKEQRIVTTTRTIVLANPRGFCAGVDRAIAIVERALALYGAPIYVRHEVVHNKLVVEELRTQGAVFIEDLTEVPDSATLIFSAHGVSQEIRAAAKLRNLRIFDATCPLVTKVHNEVTNMRSAGKEVIVIGHRGHPEVEGTLGQVKSGMHLLENVEGIHHLSPNNPDQLAFVTQTTLSIDDAAEIVAQLKNRFPNIVGPRKDDICYATQHRQDAVKRLVEICDAIIVVGSQNSSNSNRLREVAEKRGVKTKLVDSADSLDFDWLKDAKSIGITAGASAPESEVQAILARLKELGSTKVVHINAPEENVSFSLPKELLAI